MFAKAEVRKIQCKCSKPLSLLFEINTEGAVQKIVVDLVPPLERCNWYNWARKSRRSRNLKTWTGSFVYCSGCNRRHKIGTFKA